MSAQKIRVPGNLSSLKPSSALESVSMSTLARRGTGVLQKIMSTAQAVTIKIQGQGAMVTLSRQQYDDMIELVRRLRDRESDDGFTAALSQQFDELVSRMNRPDAAQATEAALFGDPGALNQTYRPGATENEA